MLTMLDPDRTTIEILQQHITHFHELPKPSTRFLPGMLEGMNRISQRIIDLLPGDRVRPQLRSAEAKQENQATRV